MREPLNSDDVEAVFAAARTPDQRRAAAARFEAWAQERHPEDDDVSPASLLVSAGEILSRVGDRDAATALFRRAVDAEGSAPPDARCYLHQALLDAGDVDGARGLADELRRERPPDGDVYVFIGENYELSGDLREAHRWMTMGLLRMEGQIGIRGDAAATFAAALAQSRYRVRRELELPLDEGDALVEIASTGG